MLHWRTLCGEREAGNVMGVCNISRDGALMSMLEASHGFARAQDSNWKRSANGVEPATTLGK